MITIDVLVSDHHGAGREALQIICDYADVTDQVTMLCATSDLPSQGIVGSPEKTTELIKFYESYGFKPSLREYIWEGRTYPDNIMERHPDDHPSTVRLR